MKHILIFILAIILLAGGYSYFFIWNKKQPDYKKLDAEFTISARSIYDDFINDPKLASMKYNGKIIQLSGEVNEVEKIDSLIIAVFVFDLGMFGNKGVRCTFLNTEKNVSALSDLTGCHIKGYCSGFNDSDVILEKCIVVKQ